MKSLKLLFASSLITFMSISLVAQPKPWVVPANFKTMKNPVAVGDASTKAGQALYTKTVHHVMGKQVWVTVSKQDLLKIFRVIFQRLIFRVRVMVIFSTKPKSEELKCQSMKAN